MIEKFASLGLAVHEHLELYKNHIEPPPAQNRGKRLCVVTGIHGDELEGQLVAYLLNQRLAEHPEYLHGTVDIYPAMNPLGINTVRRGIPLFDLDMNRIFPGNEDGPAAEYLADRAIRDMADADLAIDIHASNIFLRELPQARVSEENAQVLVPLAKKLNLDFIWVHAASTVLQSTLAHSLNELGVRCVVVEMGVGMRLTPAYGLQLTEGILCMMHSEGLWSGPVISPREPIVSRDEVDFINAGAAGIFIPQVEHNGRVYAGQVLGIIADPLTGTKLQCVTAPSDGLLFTLREYPVVYPGSLLARILKGGSEE